MCAMTHEYVHHDACICAPWLIHMYAMTHAYVRHDSCICAPWLMHMCAMIKYNDSNICAPWLKHMCAMTHAYVRMTHPYVWTSTTPLCSCRFSMTRLSYMRDTSQSCVWHDSFMCAILQPIADRVAQHLEIISKNFQFSTRRTRILMGFIIYYLVLVINPIGRILVRW